MSNKFVTFLLAPSLESRDPFLPIRPNTVATAKTLRIDRECVPRVLGPLPLPDSLLLFSKSILHPVGDCGHHSKPREPKPKARTLTQAPV